MEPMIDPNKKKPTLWDIFVYKFYSGLGYFFRFLFMIFSRNKLSGKKEMSGMNMMLFCGKKGAKMIKPLLLSVYCRWNKVPFVTIVSDGVPAELLLKFMQFWPFPYKVRQWEEAAAFHREKGRKALAGYAENNIMGRKFASILAEAEMHPTLYCDTDVLWFAEPTLPEGSPPGRFTMRMASDNLTCYSADLLKGMKREDMFTRRSLNSGVIYMSGSAAAAIGDFDKLTELLLTDNNFFAEQTAFALIADQAGDWWSLQDIILTTGDKHWPIFPGYFFRNKKNFARHHVVTKNSWFWRDALYIILFNRKKNAEGHAQ